MDTRAQIIEALIVASRDPQASCVRVAAVEALGKLAEREPFPAPPPPGCPEYVPANLAACLRDALPHLPGPLRDRAEQALRGATHNGIGAGEQVRAQRLEPEPARRHEVESRLLVALLLVRRQICGDTSKRAVEDALAFADANPPDPEGLTFEGKVLSRWITGVSSRMEIEATDPPYLPPEFRGKRVRVTFLPEPKGA